MSIYSSFDHSHWSDTAAPCEEAKIIDMHSEEVQYMKNDAKFKTTIDFDDGFKFITYETERKNSLKSYRISVNSEKLFNLAMETHSNEISRLREQGKRIYTAEESAKAWKERKTVKNQPNTWECSCGRIHKDYEGSCVCGASKPPEKRK